MHCRRRRRKWPFFVFCSLTFLYSYNIFSILFHYVFLVSSANDTHHWQPLKQHNNNNKKQWNCSESAVSNSYNYPTNSSCVNWNQYYTNCTQLGRNPFHGTISFDNIGMAWVAIFLVISLEGWTDIMYYVQDAHSFWDWIYFVLLIVVRVRGSNSSNLARLFRELFARHRLILLLK